jgi:hypothetical protein
VFRDIPFPYRHILSVFPRLAYSSTLMMEAARSSETSVNIYHIAWHRITDDSNHHLEK